MELIVSITIIVILTVVLLANFHAGQSSNEANLAIQKLASDIRRVQGYSLSLKNYAGAKGENGWGVFFNMDTTTDPDNIRKFTVFYDIDKDSKRNMDGSEDVEEIFFSKGVVLSGLRIESAAVQGQRLSVLFVPPEPIIHICDSQCDGEIDATVMLTSGANTKKVDLNIFGLVDTEN